MVCFCSEAESRTKLVAKRSPDGFPRDAATGGQISDVKDMVDEIVYLTAAIQVTGEVLHVDESVHLGKW